MVVANYGGSKEVDNDDGSLFWRVTANVMVYGWGQKFKCGGIESVGNLKAYIDLGGKFDAGCLLSGDTGARAKDAPGCVARPKPPLVQSALHSAFSSCA